MKMPQDVLDALNRLKNDPLGYYEIIANSFSWMDAKERDHMVADLHEDFSELTPDVQVSITKTLSDMAIWLDKFARNRLLYDVQTDKVSSKAAKDLADLNMYFEKKAAETQQKALKDNNLMNLLVSSDPDDQLKLYTGRRYFKGIRNLYVRLSETSVKKNQGPLSRVMVDLVVSSEFDATCASLQVKIPIAFKGSNTLERACYGRFKEFFGPVEDIEFESDDEKA